MYAVLVMGSLCPEAAFAQFNTPFSPAPVPGLPANSPYNDNDMPKLVSQYDGMICPIEEYNTPQGQIDNRYEYGVIKRVVHCVQRLFIPAAYKIMYRMSVDYLYSTITAACTLAVVLWGVLMVVGKNSAPMRDGFTAALKIGGVSMFTFVMGKSELWPYGLFPILMDSVDYMGAIVTKYIGYGTSMKCAVNLAEYDVWGRIDCALNTLIGGIFSPSMLAAGLAGFIVTALASGGIGMFIALAGIAIMGFLITAIVRSAYICITAYVALALMSIVSPIFITMILFKSTYGYFEKWLKLTISFMLQPIFLFAYLSMMLIAYDTVVYDGKFSIYRAIVPPSVIGEYPEPLRPFPPQNQYSNPDGEFYIGAWLSSRGIYQQADAMSMGVGVNPRRDYEVDEKNIGIGGSMGAKDMPEQNYHQTNSDGITQSPVESLSNIDVFKVNTDVTQVTWQRLALIYFCEDNSNCEPSQRGQDVKGEYCSKYKCSAEEKRRLESKNFRLMVDYLIQVFLSFLIAMLTMYIFYQMLDALPFIGNGVTGETNAPSLNMVNMPGSSLKDKLKSSMAKLGSGK